MAPLNRAGHLVIRGGSNIYFRLLDVGPSAPHPLQDPSCLVSHHVLPLFVDFRRQWDDAPFSNSCPSLLGISRHLRPVPEGQKCCFLALEKKSGNGSDPIKKDNLSAFGGPPHYTIA